MTRVGRQPFGVPVAHATTSEDASVWVPDDNDLDDGADSDVDLYNEKKERLSFPEADFQTVELARHKPLGCRVEESLAHPTIEKWVFVSKVSE